MGEYNLDEEYAKHLANLDALARKLHDSVHVVRVEMQTIDENLANLNRVGSGGDADFPFDDCRDVYAALADARRRIREVERIVKGYRRDLADVMSEAPGQVEPAPAGIRVHQLTRNMKVTYPGLCDGRPVRIVDSSHSGDFSDHFKVMYEDPTLVGPVMVKHLPADTLVTPYGGAA